METLNSELQQKIDSLPADKRALFLKLLKQKQPLKSMGIAVRPDNAGVPLSFAQKRFWFIEQFEQGSTAYNIPAIFHFRGELDVNVLERSLRHLIQRHEILRTVYQDQNGQGSAVLFEADSVTIQQLKTEDWSDIDFASWVDTQIKRPFDLSQEVLRVCIINRTESHYALLIEIHHIAADGVSVNLMLQELVSIYSCYLDTRPLDLPKLLIQHADYAYWQQEQARQSKFQAELEQIRKRLHGLPPIHGLALDYSRPPKQTMRGANHRMMLPGELQMQLQVLAKSQDVSLFILLQTAFASLIGRFSDQNEVVMGVPVANRGRTELQEQLGCFVNTVVLAQQVESDQNFVQLLQQNKQQFNEALALQHIPFEMVVDALGVERNLAYSPVFQIMFVFQSQGLQSFKLPGTEVQIQVPDSELSKFDLTLTLLERDDGIEAHWQYAADIFTPESIASMANSYCHLLKCLTHSVDLKVGCLELVEDQDIFALTQQQLVLEPQVCAQTIHQGFELQAERFADKIAVYCDGESLSYSDLNIKANQMAHQLLAMGLEIEGLVGIMLDRSIDTIVSILAVLKAGGAYVPIDPNQPLQRREFILGDSAVKILITDLTVDDMCLNAIILSPDNPVLTERSIGNPNVDVKSENLAYIIYTSGSTGKPKGVLIEHHNVMRLFSASTLPGYFQFDDNDCWSMFHSYAFDFSVWEIWGALIYGGKLVVVPYHISRSPELFLELMCEQKITVLNQTPSAFYMLQELVIDQNISHNLRYVIFGGEALDPTRLKHWFQRFGESKPQMINMYGITETTVHVTYRQITLKDCTLAKSVIGKPLADLNYYVCSESMALQPINAPGELYIGGPGLARGYLNRSELTEQRFINSPFVEDKLYRTGDLVRLCGDGELEYLGRTDDQVKIRGFRIELGEIEAKIKQLQIVRDAVAIVREDRPGDKKIVAYVTVLDGDTQHLDNNFFKQSLDGFLPDYMVPSAVVVLISFPLTGNGKIDKRALPKPDYIDLQSSFVPPTGNVETKLCEVISKVLGIEKVSVTDSFFALGGDSILSIKVVAEAKKQGIVFAIKDLFEHADLRRLAKVCNVVIDSSISEYTLEKQRFELASMQSGMLYHTMLEQGTAVYHDVVSYRLRLPLDVDKFTLCFKTLLAAHGILRTGFVANKESWQQVVQSDMTPPLSVFEHCTVEAQQVDQVFESWLQDEVLNDFASNGQAMYRFFIHRFADNVCQFSLSFHHGILDGWSVASFFTQLFGLYLNNSDLPEAIPQYHHFVELEQKAMACDEHRTFWQQELAGYQVMPSYAKAGQAQRFKLTYNDRLAAMGDTLKKQAAAWNMPIQHLLMTAYLRALSVCSGHQDILSCMVINGRPEMEHAEHSLGLFLNILPIRLPLGQVSELDWQGLCQHTSNKLRKAFAYRRMPFTQIQQLSSVQIPKILFNFNNFHVFNEIVGNSQIEVLGHRFHEQTDFNLELQVAQHPVTGALELTIDADSRYYDRDFCSRLADVYAAILQDICTKPQQLWRDTDLLSVEHKQELKLFENGTAVVPPYNDIVAMFKASVIQWPDLEAVYSQGECLTYQQLDVLSDSWAAQLIEQGVRVNQRVAMLMPRSVSLSIGWLAILKAGATMVPLEISLAEQRLTYIIEDAQVEMILSHSSQEKVLDDLPHNCKLLFTDELESKRTLAETLPPTMAYIIYTSGSTGRPKGVQVSNVATVSQAFAMQQVYQLNHNDRNLMFASFSFDAALEVVLVTWNSGGRLDITPDGLLSAREFVDYCQNQKVTFADLPPRYCQALLNDVSLTDFWASTTLETLVLGGESFPVGLIEQWHVLGLEGKCDIINAYGPTEAVVTASYHIGRYHDLDPVPIGMPVPGKSLYVLDEYHQRLPIGATGQLFIGGDILADGYLGREDLTRKVFKTLNIDGMDVKTYATGDWVRRNIKGEIEFIGRIDSQVQIRGYRVELGEIEQVLLQIPSISGACLVNDVDVLTAYLVTKLDPMALNATVAAYIEDKLPNYMHPTNLVVLESLPLNLSGKIDKEALPKVDYIVDNNSICSPRGPLEQKLTSIITNVLGFEIGIDSAFSNVGGTSIKALQVIAAAESEQINLSLAVLLKLQTVRKIAAAIGKNEQQSNAFVLTSVNVDKPTFIAIHPYSGNALCYNAIAQHLSCTQMVGLNGIGVMNKIDKLDSIIAMANSYIESSHQYVKDDDWLLVGYSLGGVIAQQMAVELTRRGAKRVRLILIDSLPLTNINETNLDETWRDLLFQLNIDAQTQNSVDWPIEQRLQFCREQLMAVEPMWKDITTSEFEQFLHYQMAMKKALYRHEYKEFNGRTLRLYTQDTEQSTVQVGNWQSLLSDVENRLIEGDHLSCIQAPYSQGVAKSIETWINT
jgi:amino acid adenylation domain-containing protein